MRSVSRETSELFMSYLSLVRRWNRTVNLVSRGDETILQARHLEDSVLALEAIKPLPSDATWVDLGSGGGFPGVVVAIHRRKQIGRTVLVESDRRKCSFLRTVARELAVSFEVKNERIECMEPQKAEVVSARALAALPTLLAYSHRHLVPHGLAVLMKGKGWRQEVQEAEKSWRFDIENSPDSDHHPAQVLAIRNIRRAKADY